MRLTHARLPGAAWPGVVRLASAPWWSVRLSGVVVGCCLGMVHPCPGRSPGGAGGTQAG
jgi:hypothetical protein